MNQKKQFKGESLIQKLFIIRILNEIRKIFQRDSIKSYFQTRKWKAISGSSIHNERLFCSKRFELDGRSSCSREEKWEVNTNIFCIISIVVLNAKCMVAPTLLQISFLVGQLFMPSQLKECVTRELFLWL